MLSESAVGLPKDLPRVIGGYRLIRELSRGPLGPVVLARHRATGRPVALTVLRPEWACLPKYVARLSRDAFAAAQVGHPNLVRLLEIGEAQGRVFFASEYADGMTLADRVIRQKALPAREAVAHVLQAARGLMFAHGHGLAHGDVTPENLLLDDGGTTRVAGLGLVKTPQSVEAEEARAAIAPIPVGLPAQAEAAGAPFRDDIRGLGRSLEHLLTGQPAGGDGPEGLLARGVPANLVELVRGLTEARPGAGYDDLTRVVPALERFLNARRPETTPREEHTRVLTECVAAFRASPAARLRARVLPGAGAACGVLVFLALLARSPVLAGSFLGLGLMTALASFVIGGVTRGGDLFVKVRALVMESRGGDWLIGLAVAVLLVTTLVVLGLHLAWLAFGVVALSLAAAVHFVLDRKVEAERRGAVEEASALLKGLRLQGVSEESLRRFVRSTAGGRWEEFFEALFGSDARRAAREPSERGWRGLARAPHLVVRDGITGWVEARQGARRVDRERSLLQAIEERGLVAEGVNLLTARRKARRIAEAMVAVSRETRAAADAEARPTVADAVRQASEAPEAVLLDHEGGLVGPDSSWIRELLLGARTRFLLGSALVAGCLLWVHQNGVISGAQIKDVAARAIEAPDPLRTLRDARIDVRVPGRTAPLDVPFLPRAVTRLVRGFHAGAAGLILILSAMMRGSRVGDFAVPGAAIALLGPAWGVARLGPLDAPSACIVLGVGVACLAFVFGRARGD